MAKVVIEVSCGLPATVATNCPVCGSSALHVSIAREGLPVFQNVVHASHAEAIAAPRGRLLLATCGSCGFSFNSAFDPSLIVYDPAYDNFVASQVFREYYEGLSEFLIDRFCLESGQVYDIGCGKGEFLAVLCGLAPGIRGTGIDPSCNPGMKENFELVRDRFRSGHFVSNARLIICRHVLEHLHNPVGFLSELAEAAPDAPLYLEVPAFEWILANGAFWDFCYEHCNYFTRLSLNETLQRAGWRPEASGTAFGEQYQWVIARVSPTAPSLRDARCRRAPEAAVAAVMAYAEKESRKLADLRTRARRTAGVALWGMATKGVMLSFLLPDGVLGGVDMNERKQGKYAPGSGVMIHAPSWLGALQRDVPVLVTNPNYLSEIKTQAAAVRPDLELLPV